MTRCNRHDELGLAVRNPVLKFGASARARFEQDMQYQEQRKAMQSGMPSFQIYVRTKVNNMW